MKLTPQHRIAKKEKQMNCNNSFMQTKTPVIFN